MSDSLGTEIHRWTRCGWGMRAHREAGDISFDAFYAAEYERVLKTAVLVTRDQAVAEEVAQEAFAKAYASWWRVSRYEMPDAWVRKVAMRMAMRQVQRKRVWETIAQTLPREKHVDDERPDDRVAAAVAQLPPGQRVAITLHYFEDRPISEIAEIMDCAQSTVKVHLYRARQRLALLLGVEDVDA